LRQIGTIPRDLDPRRFLDHLTTLGMRMRVDERPDGWVIWVHNEDHLAQARRELDDYLKNPDDPRYRDARQSAEAVRREEQRRDREYRRNVRDMTGHWDGLNVRRRPLTIALMGISIAVYLTGFTDFGGVIERALLFCTYWRDSTGYHASGLDEILHGEVWRLVTPIFLHFTPFHILFNMWAMRDIGTLIEYRRGTKTLAILVLLSAVASNTGQFALKLALHQEPHPFGGMSGVLYALFGYVWMKGRHEPEQGMIPHPTTVKYMLFWLILCFTGKVGPIANGAHVVGLVVGVLLGLARF
jgi:GlpG protein